MNIPLWALVHLPVVVTITTAVFTPKGWLHCILYVLFENAMGIVKLWAVIAGIALPISSCSCHSGKPLCMPVVVCSEIAWPVSQHLRLGGFSALRWPSVPSSLIT